MNFLPGRTGATAGLVLWSMMIAAWLASSPAMSAASSAVRLTRAQCSVATLGASIATRLIGEAVAGVTLNAPVWNDATADVPAHCMVTGAMLPVDKSATAQPIQFGVALPAVWQRIAVQMGGGGLNGTIPALTGGGSPGGVSQLSAGIATYGSDSGHSVDPGWALNDEAIRNLAYMQMKKTHDAAMVIMQRAYAAKPKYNYYVGSSQGGREGLTVAQRYPADYDGVVASVPIVNFTGLMHAPEWIRSQEKQVDNWVPTTKSKAIISEFMRQCDGLDGLMDGVINNYVACRAIFNINDDKGVANPWSTRRCINNIDPDPRNESASACLTDGQIATLNFIFSSYDYQQALANNVTSFGMWAPTTELGGGIMMGPPGGMPAGMPGMAGASGVAGMRGGMVMATLLTDSRYRGQEGAAVDAPVYSQLGAVSITGFIMKDLSANPLDYVEGGQYNARRIEISGWLDSTNPDLSAFRKRGGKLIVTIGTNDPIASPGAQLDYYQSVLDKMGRRSVDSFARFYVLPQTGHGLTGSSYTLDGSGRTLVASEIPSTFDRLALIRNWVEQGIAPGKSERVSGSTGSRPMCSYPEYPEYLQGDITQAGSYACSAP